MLHISEPQLKIQSSAPHPDHPVQTMSGRRLNRLTKQATPTDRALIASDLARGAVQILRPTYAQAAALTRVSAGYVATVGRLTEEERRQLARGQLSLPRLHNRQCSDRALDRLVERYGIEALWRALDRAMAPTNGR